MARWFVIRDGSEHGPLSNAELKSAAAAGKIRPDDAIRREDGKVTRPARDVKGLTFAADLNSRLLTADDDFDSIDPFNLKAASPETGIAACLAEKEKIRNALLPRAYAVLGKKYFEAVDHSSTGQTPPPEVAPFVEQVDALLLNAPTPSGPGTQSTTDPARERAVEHQLAKKYAQLGKRAYEVGKLSPTFLTEHNAIQDLLQRDKLLTTRVDVLRVEAKRRREADELAAQLRKAKQTAVAVADTMKGAGESLIYSTPLLVILATLIPPVGLWLIWQHPSWGIKSKIRWTGLSMAVFLTLIMANQVRTAFLTATEATLNAKDWALDQVNTAVGLQNAAPDPAPQGEPQAPPPPEKVDNVPPPVAAVKPSPPEPPAPVPPVEQADNSQPTAVTLFPKEKRKTIHNLVHIPPEGPSPRLRWISVDEREAEVLSGKGYWRHRSTIGYGAASREENAVPLWRHLSASDNCYRYILQAPSGLPGQCLLAWVWTKRLPGMIEVFVLENGVTRQLVAETERENGQSKRDWLVSNGLFKEEFSFFLYPHRAE